MSSKNSAKVFAEGNFYHAYNRGVEKREIFLDKQDCTVFLHYLKLYLSPIEEIQHLVNVGSIKPRFLHQNVSHEVELVAFALMPNHFHMLLKQSTKEGVPKLMRRLNTAYVMYFNKKYNRVGRLFQNTYKCCLVNTDEYLTHLSRYIHLNPRRINSPIGFNDFSSYKFYLGTNNASWVKPNFVLQYFSEHFSYKSFVEEFFNDSNPFPSNLKLEDACD